MHFRLDFKGSKTKKGVYLPGTTKSILFPHPNHDKTEICNPFAYARYGQSNTSRAKKPYDRMACILKRRASTTQSEIHFSNGLEYSQTDKKQCWRGQDLRSTFVPLAGQSSILVYNTCVVVMTIHGSITTTGRGAIFRFNKSPCFCLFDCSLCSELSVQSFLRNGLLFPTFIWTFT